ncbi:MAG: hypothetical protein V3W19_02610 [Desulfatiglandales bacterium]
MTKDFAKSTEMARDFDIIEELEKTIDEIDKAVEISETDDVPDRISYLRFLVKDLDKALSGEYEGLRQRRFVIRREE